MRGDKLKRIISAILIVMILSGCSQKPAEPVETAGPAVQPAAEPNEPENSRKKLKSKG